MERRPGVTNPLHHAISGARLLATFFSGPTSIREPKPPLVASEAQLVTIGWTEQEESDMLALPSTARPVQVVLHFLLPISPLFQTGLPMPTSIPSGPPFQWREAGFILGGWILITIIAGVITAISNPCNLTIPWTRLVANQSAQFGVWAVLTPGIFWLTRLPSRPRRRFFALQAGGLVGALSLITLLRPLIHNFALHAPDEQHAFLEWMGTSFVRHVHLDALVYAGLFVVGLALTHYRRSQERGRRAAALEAELSKAQLQVLQTQVNPHFLFNALNTISGLAEDDPATTRRILARLSSLLRRSLDTTKGAAIPLGEELSFVRQYLDIMQIRYGNELSTTVDVPANLDTALVPAFALQILVENAIKHGISQNTRAGLLHITAHRAGHLLVIRVEDNGPGCTAASDTDSCGVGLANLRSRLHQLYGDESRLTLTNVPGNRPDAPPTGARITLRIPYCEDASRLTRNALLGPDSGTAPPLSEIFPTPAQTSSPPWTSVFEQSDDRSAEM